MTTSTTATTLSNVASAAGNIPAESGNVSSENLEIFFSNIDGFISKRSFFLNSDLALKFGIYIFQESNITEHHSGYDDWSLARLNCIQLTKAKQAPFHRGMLLGWTDGISVARFDHRVRCPFEISCVRVCVDSGSLTMVYGRLRRPWRLSPSFLDRRTLWVSGLGLVL